MDKAEKILQETTSYVLSTIDQNNFPSSIVLTKVLKRFGYVTLFFYLDECSQPVINMKKVPRGSVSCSIDYSDRIETLNLRGTFYIESNWKVKKIRKIVEEVQDKLKIDEAVIVVFETMYHEVEIVNKLI